MIHVGRFHPLDQTRLLPAAPWAATAVERQMQGADQGPGALRVGMQLARQTMMG